MGLLAAAATDEVVTTMPEALVNTALGMGTVFLVLILISFIIYLMKFIPELLDRSSGKKEVAPAPRKERVICINIFSQRWPLVCWFRSRPCRSI